MHVIQEKMVRWPADMAIEIVERKGKGHPDSIADAMVEEISRQYSQYCLDNFGKILHHNVDKAQLTAGRAAPRFGDGQIIKPVVVYLSGRATPRFENTEIPTPVIALNAVRHIAAGFNAFPPYTVINQISEGSAELKSLLTESPRANDTSIGVGFAPYTRLEKTVLEVERYLNGPGKKPWTGEDVKVMGVRRGQSLEITAAVAFVSKEIESLTDYYEKKAALEQELKEKFDIDIKINTADKNENIYLTVSGLSVEMGDDGAVGRGNRVNGLITPMRPMSMEAAAGKNPVNHVGKIYNVLAQQIAERIYKEEQEKVSIFLVSKIGYPLDQPWVLAIEGGGPRARAIAEEEITKVGELTQKFVKGALNVF